jgi:hypothetical protein
MTETSHNFSINQTTSSVIWCAMVDRKTKLTSIIQQSEGTSVEYAIAEKELNSIIATMA